MCQGREDWRLGSYQGKVGEVGGGEGGRAVPHLVCFTQHVSVPGLKKSWDLGKYGCDFLGLNILISRAVLKGE